MLDNLIFRCVRVNLKPENGIKVQKTCYNLLGSFLTTDCFLLMTLAARWRRVWEKLNSQVWAGRLLSGLWQWLSQGLTIPTGILLQQSTESRSTGGGLEIQSEHNIGAAVLTVTNSDSVAVPVFSSWSQFASALLSFQRLASDWVLGQVLLYLSVMLSCRQFFLMQDSDYMIVLTSVKASVPDQVVIES